MIAPSVFAFSDPERGAQFHQWLAAIAPNFSLDASRAAPIAADAGSRRYFRIASSGAAGSFILMDAPESAQDCAAFARVAQRMRAAGLRVPEIYASDETLGFMLLEDFGAHTLLQALQAGQLNAHSIAPYLQAAIESLCRWQQASLPATLPIFDGAFMAREFDLFEQWFVRGHLRITLKPEQNLWLQQTRERLLGALASLPALNMHRDFILRNLMPLPPSATGTPSTSAQTLGILDFQSAMQGPVSYDILSLLRDAFWSWEESFVNEWLNRYWVAARRVWLPVPPRFADFRRMTDWVGLQRHIKILGGFARSALRDGKARYLQEAPRFVTYIRTSAGRYASEQEFAPLLRLLDSLPLAAPEV